MEIIDLMPRHLPATPAPADNSRYREQTTVPTSCDVETSTYEPQTQTGEQL